MAVYTLDFHGCSVDKKYPVNDFHLPEPYLLLQDFERIPPESLSLMIRV